MRRTSSSAGIDGYPSLSFSLEGTDLERTNLLVLTREHLYLVMTLGPKGLPNGDAKRFLKSFRVVETAESRASDASSTNPVAGPERAVREFVRALAMHDTQAFERAIQPDPRASRFINPEPLTPEGQVEAARRLETLQVSRRDDVLLRGLTLALIALDRDEALRYALPGAEIGVLFADAPSVREPSGVLEAAAMEMPLVEVGSGEFYRMPSGRVVEGSTAVDRKVIVGQFGPVEMPFVLRRVGGAWRVEAEPYFALINR
jgi:hypothetical protein